MLPKWVFSLSILKDYIVYPIQYNNNVVFCETSILVAHKGWVVHSGECNMNGFGVWIKFRFCLVLRNLVARNSIFFNPRTPFHFITQSLGTVDLYIRQQIEMT
ncbi:hypothetical protein DM860_006383 [Cuscuta australis]|uniref:Uncharacterized protein n=1 Tax=Cuscuta australis TaxID=267555 RepID=A0A328D8J4_9ASTE|nr:hypothetical protein DM860_006383 [Cuscuta australis]